MYRRQKWLGAILFTGIVAAFYLGSRTQSLATDDDIPFVGEKTSWHGFDRYDFLMDESELSIKPHRAAPGEGNAVRTAVQGQLRCVVVVPKEVSWPAMASFSRSIFRRPCLH